MMDRVAAAARLLGARARPGVPLGPLTTYRVGGPAALLVELGGDDDATAAAEAVSASGVPVLAVGGIENHIHLCIELPATMSVADAINIFKSNSSRWMKTKGVKDFSWQIGYGAFSLSPRLLGAVKTYIRNQREHHKSQTYEEEFIGFLKRAGIEYDPDSVFD